MPPRNKRYVIPFEQGRAAFAVHVSRRFEPTEIGPLLGFESPRPTIYVTGGAGGMSPQDIHATRQLVEKGLARFAQERNVTVIDGGTNSGVPVLTGDARQKLRGTFPLIGVTPLELVRYPGYENEGENINDLNTAHSHFVLTVGDEFGDESETITHLTYALSGMGQQPALGILINGGKITRKEVHARTTSELMSFPLIIIEGTGRFADLLATAYHSGQAEEPDVMEIITKGRLQSVSVKDGPEVLYNRLSRFFNAFKPKAIHA